MSNFVPLHLHSSFSYQDSLTKIPELVIRAKELGMKAVCLTDHANLSGIVQFYQECKKQDIKPILGVEIYFTPNHEDKERSSRHLTVLCKNNQGLENIIRMLTKANMPIEEGGGFFYRPRNDWSDLEEYNEGLIILTGCMNSPVNRPFWEDDSYEIGREQACRILDIFGRDRVFVELQNVNEDNQIYIPEQQIILERSRKLAKDLCLESVATNDSHYVLYEDYKTHEILKAIDAGGNLNTPIVDHSKGVKRGRLVFSGYDYYLRSDKEMREKFTDEEVDTTWKIAEMCNVELEFGKNKMPKFDQDMDDEAAYEFLLEQLRKGWMDFEINKKKNKKEYEERIKRELKDIKEAGLQNYFLIVWDVCRFCDENSIPRGYGRGSASGSLCSHLLKITQCCDPIRYGLIWERFWNRGRAGSPPDIDLDICIERREEVIEYLKDKFGRDRVFPMVTIDKMETKAAFKDVGKALCFDFAYMNNFTKYVPHKCKNVADAIERSEYIKKVSEGIDDDVEFWQKQIKESKNAAEVEELEELIKKRQENLKELFKHTQRLEGITRGKSTHACALLVANEDIDGKVPLVLNQTGGVKRMVTAWDMRDLEKLGYLKLDILGLKTLTVASKVIPNYIEAMGNFDDHKVFDLICSGNTKGMFQIEKGLGKQWVQKIGPRSIEEISDLISLIRPGTLETGLADQYVEAKEGREIKLLHEDLRPILKDTYNTMTYQEQLLAIVAKFAGFDLATCDLLRRNMAKKQPEEMAKHKREFVNGCLSNNYSEEVASKLWEWIDASSGYLFNKSHGVGYALVTYLTAYLKLYHPLEFYCTMLQLSKNKQDSLEEIRELYYDANLFNIEILPPSLKNANEDFEIVDGKIYYGLSHIKSIGRGSIGTLKSLRGATWSEIVDGASGIKKNVLEALIFSGALDYLGERHLLDKSAKIIRQLTPREIEIWKLIEEGGEKEVKLKKETRRHKFKKETDTLKIVSQFYEFLEKYNPSLKFINSNRAEKLSHIMSDFITDYDKELSIKQLASLESYYLGMSLTCSAVDVYDDSYKTHDLIDVKRELDNRGVYTIGIVTRIYTKKDRNGNEMAFISLVDSTYMLDCVVFSSVWVNIKEGMKEGIPIKVDGRVSRGSLIVNNVDFI